MRAATEKAETPCWLKLTYRRWKCRETWYYNFPLYTEKAQWKYCQAIRRSGYCAHSDRLNTHIFGCQLPLHLVGDERLHPVTGRAVVPNQPAVVSRFSHYYAVKRLRNQDTLVSTGQNAPYWNVCLHRKRKYVTRLQRAVLTSRGLCSTSAKKKTGNNLHINRKIYHSVNAIMCHQRSDLFTLFFSQLLNNNNNMLMCDGSTTSLILCFISF